MSLRKHLRLISVFLIGLAGAGMLAVGFGLTPLSSSVLGSMLGLGPKADFSLTSNSDSIGIQQGYTGSAIVTVSSLNHFSGAVGLTATITPSGNAPTVTLGQSTVTLTTGGTSSVSINTATASSTTLGYYNITVQAKANSIAHSMAVSVHVTPPPPPPTPGFYLSANPSSLSATQGSIVTSTLSVNSILAYSGNVALTASIYPSGPNSPSVSLNLTSLLLPANGANTTSILVNTFNSTIQSYTIIITGTSGSLTHFLGISLSVGPFAGSESLTLEYLAINSGTSVTLDLRNTGSVTTTLVSYYVTDAAGDKYTLADWAGPTMSPNQLGVANILIGASCPSCSLLGSPFTFSPGNSYAIGVTTGYNNLFLYAFTISARESLSLDSFAFINSTAVTLYVRNTGSISVTLAAYYVTDSSGDQYVLPSFPGPTIAPNTVAAVTVTIGSNCPACTLSGNPYTFTPGNSYAILFVTSRNNQFTFVVTK